MPTVEAVLQAYADIQTEQRQTAAATTVGETLQIVGAGVDAGVRIGEEEIDAVEAHAIDPRGGGKIEHGVEFDTVQGMQSAIAAGGSRTGLPQISQAAVDLGMSDIFAQEKSGID